MLPIFLIKSHNIPTIPSKFFNKILVYIPHARNNILLRNTRASYNKIIYEITKAQSMFFRALFTCNGIKKECA